MRQNEGNTVKYVIKHPFVNRTFRASSVDENAQAPLGLGGKLLSHDLKRFKIYANKKKIRIQ